MLARGEIAPECESGLSTVEYILEGKEELQNVFIFVIDVSVGPSEIRSIRDSLKEVFSTLPENVSVAIITFSRYLKVYNLMEQNSVHSLIIDGIKTKKVEDFLKDLSTLRCSSMNP